MIVHVHVVCDQHQEVIPGEFDTDNLSPRSSRRERHPTLNLWLLQHHDCDLFVTDPDLEFELPQGYRLIDWDTYQVDQRLMN
jgi:hypothetical protein